MDEVNVKLDEHPASQPELFYSYTVKPVCTSTLLHGNKNAPISAATPLQKLCFLQKCVRVLC